MIDSTIIKIIIILAIFFGIFSFQKLESKLLKVLFFGFVLSFISSFFDRDLFFDFSFISFGIFVLTYFIYSLYLKKLVPASISFFALASFIFKILYWPFASEIRVVMLIPLVLFIISLINFEKYKSQISILSIIAAYEFTEFFQLFF